MVLALAALTACSSSGGGKDPFVEPETIASKDGVLEATFEVTLDEIEVGGTQVAARLYDGQFMPPTLSVQPGDLIRLTLANRIDELTNLHYHGMNVSPLGNGDNVFLHVVPGETFQYEVQVPETHPEGLFYYHPHIYGTTEFQIGNGMSGGIVVRGILDDLGSLSDVKQRQIFLKDIQIVDGAVPDPPDSGAPTLRTVNGRVGPGHQDPSRRDAVLGDRQHRRRHLLRRPPRGAHALRDRARRQPAHAGAAQGDRCSCRPSARIGVLVQGGEPGEYALETQAIDMGPQGDQYPEVTLATVIVEGKAEAPLVLPTTLPPIDPDLRGTTIAQRRSYQFSENTDGDQFYINGLQFDANRIDTTVTLGDVEEWTIENCSGENHVFHIHQLDFQVIEVNGVPQPYVGRQDTVNLDYRDTDGPVDCPTDDDPRGRVKVLIPFTEETNLGKFVYHCHIGEHEDNGMMQVIEVVP